MSTTFSIRGRSIGAGLAPYVIAELSANHNQSFDTAVALVREAKACGADAVKLQTYTPDTITLDAHTPHFRAAESSLWSRKTLYEVYEEAYTPWEWQPELKKLADELDLTLFSTPFDFSAVDFLEEMNVPAYKVASFELVDLPLIERIARTDKPIILSTGMGSLAEIGEALGAARGAGTDQIALLKCTSAYPSLPEDIHLRTIPHLAEAFDVPVGLSDHTLGIAVPVAAVAVGANIIEKHFTLSRAIPGPDSAFSLEPDEFRAMVQAVRCAHHALGQVHYGPTRNEAASRNYRRSLYVVQDVRKGEAFSLVNVRSIRPGFGLPPKFLPEILDRRATRDLARGTPLSWKDIS